MSGFSQTKYNRYDKNLELNRKAIYARNGFDILCKHVVGQDGWTKRLDWQYGDHVVSHSSWSFIATVEDKAGGEFGFPVKLTQLTHQLVKIDYFAFYDLQKRQIYFTRARDVRKLYYNNQFYCEQNDAVDDKKSGLVRFRRDDLLQFAWVLQ